MENFIALVVIGVGGYIAWKVLIACLSGLSRAGDSITENWPRHFEKIWTSIINAAPAPPAPPTTPPPTTPGNGSGGNQPGQMRDHLVPLLALLASPSNAEQPDQRNIPAVLQQNREQSGGALGSNNNNLLVVLNGGVKR